MGKILNGLEKKLFDGLAVEMLAIAGTDGSVLWKFVKFPTGVDPKLAVDCLYEEPVPLYYSTAAAAVKHYRPFNVLMHFEEPTASYDATENGLNIRHEGVFWFARKNLEDVKIPLDDQNDLVSVGDIIQFFSKGQIWYFEFINVERTGFENDSSVWTGYRADGVRNFAFRPEQKIPK